MENNEQLNLTENEFEILRTVMFEECLDYFNSTDVNFIAEKTKLSNVYIRKVLKKLKDNLFIEEGMKKGRSRTYFITHLGYEFVLNIIAKSSNTEIKNMKEEISQFKSSKEDGLNEK